MSDYFICPHCGAKVPLSATACPECGSDDETGWSEDSRYDDLWSFVDENYGAPKQASRENPIPWTKLIAAGLLLIFVLAIALNNGTMGLILLLAIVLVAGAAYYRHQSQVNKPGTTYFLYQSLLQRAHGDEALVDRLIAYERERNPQANSQQLMEDALIRWNRDNRIR